MGEIPTHEPREEVKETLEHYLIHDQVPADHREEVVEHYDAGEYLRGLELLLNHW